MQGVTTKSKSQDAEVTALRRLNQDLEWRLQMSHSQTETVQTQLSRLVDQIKKLEEVVDANPKAKRPQQDVSNRPPPYCGDASSPSPSPRPTTTSPALEPLPSSSLPTHTPPPPPPPPTPIRTPHLSARTR